MIASTVVEKIFPSVCAITRMDVQHDKMEKLNADILLRSLKVVATGFLISDDTCLTNRHVLDLIQKDNKANGHHNNWYAQFLFPKDDQTWEQKLIRIGKTLALLDPTGANKLDVGLFKFRDSGLPDGCFPVTFGKLEEIAVGLDVGMCGFPYGDEMLNKLSIGERFGPMFHQGMISGLSPFINVDPRQLLLVTTDISTASGFSGSPLFNVTTGNVLALHSSGVEGVLGLSFPIDEKRVNGWIELLNQGHGEAKLDDGNSVEMRVRSLTLAGDIIEC